MWAAVDQNGINRGSIRSNNYYWVLFYIFFMIIGNFFLMNLFAAVVTDQFT